MRHVRFMSAVGLAAALAGCGDTATNTENPDMVVVAPPDMVYTGFVQPAGTVAVGFSVDDTANKVFAQGDLEWKGAMTYDKLTRKIAMDATWAGPFAPLWDDGPWDVNMGHEPKGAVAGDHKWGITVFATPPAAAGSTDKYGYGLNDASYVKLWPNSGWVWIGSNGEFDVAAGATTPVKATGQTFPAFGNVDVQLTLDKNAIDMTTAWDTSAVAIKGSAWFWGQPPLTDDGTGKFVFTLSAFIGAGKPLNHSGLVNSGDKPEFIFVLGAAGGKEYKDGSGVALKTGVTAQYKPSGGAFMPLAVNVASSNNTSITIP